MVTIYKKKSIINLKIPVWTPPWVGPTGSNSEPSKNPLKHTQKMSLKSVRPFRSLNTPTWTEGYLYIIYVLRWSCLKFSGYAPLIPFISTIAKQRGYSSFIVGLIFAVMPIPGMLAKVIFGSLTDKYNCRRLAFVLSSILTSLLVLIMLLIPHKSTNEEMDDSDAVRSPLFWLFLTTATLFATTATVKNVLEDTICMNLLGKLICFYG